MDYITKICLLLDECAEWDSAYTHSEAVISRKLSMNDDYLRDQRMRDSDHSEVDNGYYSYSKYFNLIINLLLIKNSDFKFESKVKYLHFKKGVMEILFQELVDKAIFSNELKAQYKPLLYSTYAITIARINRFGSISEIPELYKTNSNPKGIATFEQISNEIGFDRRALTNRINLGQFISQLMVAKIKALIQSYHSLAPRACDMALLTLDQIPLQRTKQRSSYTGTISHPVLENFFRKVLINLGIASSHEKFINRPHSYHRIDTFIEIASLERRKLINKLDSTIMKHLGLNFNRIKEILIDYNIPSKRHIDSTIDKIEKYIKEERLLIIAFYGEYSKEIFEMVRMYLDSLDREVYYTKNLHFIDLMDLAKLFSINRDQLKELDSINELIIGSLKFREGSLEDLEDLSAVAVYELELSNKNYLE